LRIEGTKAWILFDKLRSYLAIRNNMAGFFWVPPQTEKSRIAEQTLREWGQWPIQDNRRGFAGYRIKTFREFLEIYDIEISDLDDCCRVREVKL